LFDLDGTLVDSVYQHVLAWREALEQSGIELAVWRIHRRIGMSGGLFVNALLREIGRAVTSDDVTHIQRLHAEAYARLATGSPASWCARVAGAPLATGCALGRRNKWTSGNSAPGLDLLGLGPQASVITRDEVQYAKPDPDLFLAAASRLGMPIDEAVVVGDSIWDPLAARRARALGVGLLSGGYGQDELERAGAYRVYQDPADLLRHLDEVGVRTGG